MKQYSSFVEKTCSSFTLSLSHFLSYHIWPKYEHLFRYKLRSIMFHASVHLSASQAQYVKHTFLATVIIAVKRRYMYSERVCCRSLSSIPILASDNAKHDSCALSKGVQRHNHHRNDKNFPIPLSFECVFVCACNMQYTILVHNAKYFMLADSRVHSIPCLPCIWHGH